MKVYWNDKSKQAEIVENIKKEDAKPWDTTVPKSHIMIGKGRIFIYPPDYHIDGYELTREDLEELIRKI